MAPKVSVIVAVYNVEEYIERCLHTLFGQTLESLEYIFVDDASPDSSMKILEDVLEKYPHRKSQVKIIRHPENQGVALARTSGILAASGEYLIHCDPDDYVDIDMYESMYEEAKKNDSDVVVCDYWQEGDDSKTVRRIRYEDTGKRILETMANGYHFRGGPLWNFLTKRSIVINNKIFPLPHADFEEDTPCRIKTIYYSDRATYINKPFYHYCLRSDSLTGEHAISEKKIQSFQQNLNEIIIFFNEKGEYLNLLNLLKLRYKFFARNLYRGRNEKGWFNLYKEAHKSIFYYREMPLMQRIFWSVTFSNYYLYRLGSKSYKLIKGKEL